MNPSFHRYDVIVIGGALKADSQAVWQRIVDEAGGPGSRISVFPTAAYEPARVAAQIVASLNRCGAQADVLERLGRVGEAREAYLRAAELTDNAVQRELLTERARRLAS